MPHDRFHHPFSQALTAIRLQHEYISNVRVGGEVRDHARESYLRALPVDSKTQRILGGTRHNLARNALRPVARSQETMNDVQVQPFTVSAQQELAAAFFENFTSWVSHGLRLYCSAVN